MWTKPEIGNFFGKHCDLLEAAGLSDNDKASLDDYRRLMTHSVRLYESARSLQEDAVQGVLSIYEGLDDEVRDAVDYKRDRRHDMPGTGIKS